MSKQYDAAKIEDALATAELLLRNARTRRNAAGDRGWEQWYDGQAIGLLELMGLIRDCEVKGDE